LLWLKLQKIKRRRRGVNNAGHRRQKRVQRTVVIIGGNFAGLASLWELKQWQFGNNNNNDDSDDDVRIVLIDQRDYSEYTPGTKFIVHPSSRIGANSILIFQNVFNFDRSSFPLFCTY
jgi:hypothetical protein